MSSNSAACAAHKRANPGMANGGSHESPSACSHSCSDTSVRTTRDSYEQENRDYRHTQFFYVHFRSPRFEIDVTKAAKLAPIFVIPQELRLVTF
jgi:hypothetical protein